ncbi:PH domain-containing protein [Halococcus agarilyticus]|uniref:PH domain-containing protein n=1 Tax=Halococcus agarilyticus TaxID=1232219 RepID=UPI000677D703|nr:PH domain-containing protein [Halococcus agarilyticus]
MERLDSRIRVVWLGSALVTALVVGAVVTVADRRLFEIGIWVGPAVFGVLAVLGVVYTLKRYRIWGFDIEADAVTLERGVVIRVNSVVPFVRVQHVDSQRGPIERLAGLSSVVVYTAGSRGADVTIPGLRPERAEAIQAELRRLATESEPGDPEDAV